MTDSPPYSDSGGDTGVEPSRGSTSGAPRWVKVSGIIALAVVLLVVVMLLAGGGPGGHGPGRHIPGGNAPGSQTPPSGVPERSGGHTGPPAGVEHGAP
jgi:hypothetical protein